MSLERFIDAQSRDYATALSEIRAGKKVTHWMWYIFPQLAALGHSENAKYYGIADLSEAKAYLAHDILGPRLIEISMAVLAHADVAAEDVLGPVDATKLRSCASLFEQAGPGPFGQIIDTFYEGLRDPLTWLELGLDPASQ